jgi:hypothetical protein
MHQKDEGLLRRSTLSKDEIVVPWEEEEGRCHTSWEVPTADFRPTVPRKLHGWFHGAKAGASLSLRVWPNHFIRATAIPCSSVWGITESVVLFEYWLSFLAVFRFSSTEDGINDWTYSRWPACCQLSRVFSNCHVCTSHIILTVH